MAVPKIKTSRSRSRSRRANWKISLPQLVKTVKNRHVVYNLPHYAKKVFDSSGNPLYLEYKNRKVCNL